MKPKSGASRRSRSLSALVLTALLAPVGAAIDAQAPQPSSSQGGGLLGGAPPPEAPRAAQIQTEVAVPAPSTPRPTIVVPRVSARPNVDGNLNDDVWAQAVRITDFVQRDPAEGASATEKTEVFIAYDSTNLYFGFHAHYSDPRLVRANRSDRDQFSQDDVVSVYFDPFLDEQRAYVFTVNGYGVQGDSIAGGGGGNGGGFNGGGGGGGGGIPRGDASWDVLFETAGTLVPDGWTAEMAIPFKSLRYPARGEGEPHRWGFQIARSIQSKNEADVWAPVTRAIQGFIPQMGTIEGMTDLSTSRNLEFLPTFTAIKPGSLDTATGVFSQTKVDPEAGISVKYGVTSDLIADFTFNPDFSQVESDQPQIEVNRRFPLFYPELRPFFLEGQDVFDTRGEVNLVHTRTIVDPRVGAKLTGKIRNLSLGILLANDEAPGRVDDPASPAFGQTAQFFVGRLRYDLYPGSYVGAIVTDREFLDSYSRIGGADGRFRVGRTDNLEFRIARAQARDEDGSSRDGTTYDVGLSHNARHLEYSLRHFSVDPGFSTAMGFVNRTDTRRTRGEIRYRWWPESWVTNWGPNISYERNYDFAGVLQDENTGVGVNTQFASNLRFNAGIDRRMERFGGIDFWKWRRQFFGQVGTSRRISFGGGFNWGDDISYTDTPFLGRSTGGRLFVNVLPFSRLRSNLNIDYSRLEDPRDDSEVFDVKIVRGQTTYQFTERLLLRSILQYNTLDETFDANFLVTYRVNSGTVFLVGYDDHYRRSDRINDVLFRSTAFRQTNRAFFTKLSYLFRY